MIETFEQVIVSKIKTRIRDIHEEHSNKWEDFKKSLKEEYFMEDLERVTKRTFLEWVAKPNQVLSATEL